MKPSPRRSIVLLNSDFLKSSQGPYREVAGNWKRCFLIFFPLAVNSSVRMPHQEPHLQTSVLSLEPPGQLL